MYKYLSVLLLAFMMQLSATDAVDGKVYVNPKSVRMMKKGILVRTPNGRFFAPSIAKDETGLFVNQAELVAAPEMAKAKRGCGCRRKNNAPVDGQNQQRRHPHHGHKHHHWKNQKNQAVQAPGVVAQ